ncbi:hypothetical protein CKA32_006674 [Geitlerinema sp. FC II]|nr:hypothetical protein CKA32_006674 [Geitlerinema sp. FC II]
MSIDKVAIDASPLISLFKSQQADILPQLFSEIVVSDAVWEEVTETKDDRAAVELPQVDWVSRKATVAVPEAIASWDLGKGETSVLSFALANRDYWAVVDDARARRAARTLGITT